MSLGIAEGHHPHYERCVYTRRAMMGLDEVVDLTTDVLHMYVSRIHGASIPRFYLTRRDTDGVWYFLSSWHVNPLNTLAVIGTRTVSL